MLPRQPCHPLLTTQGRYEDMLQQKLALQQQLQSLCSEGVLAETPGKKKTEGQQRASPLTQTLLRKQEQLEVLLGVQVRWRAGGCLDRDGRRLRGSQ